MKLRSKIIVTISGIVLAMGIMMGIFVSQIVEEALNRQLENKGIALLKLAAEDIANPLLDGEVLTVQRMLEALVSTGGGIEYAYVTSLYGNNVIHTFAGGFPPGLASANAIPAQLQYQIKTIPTDRGPIRDAGVKVIDGLDVELHVGFSQADILASIKDVKNTVLSVTAVGILLGVLAALFISGKITLPLVKLTEHVSRLGTGELTEIKWKNGKDEISNLAACFNKMTFQLRDNIERIQTSEENYRMLIEAASDAGEGIVLLEATEGVANGKIIYVNEEYAALTGFNREELLAMNFHRVIHPEYLPEFYEIWQQGHSNGSYPRRITTAIRRKNGKKIYLETSFGQTEYQGKKAVICFNHDITEKKREEILRNQLLGKVIVAQEEERKRIGRELHDETSQSLAALVVGLKTVSHMITSKDDGVEEVIEELKVGANSALKELHQIIYDLRPSLLDDLGLIPALQWYTEHKLGAQGIEAEIEVHGYAARLPGEMEVAVFRIIQEACTNIVKHSQASKVLLTISYEVDTLQVEVADNGCGFDINETYNGSSKRGLGLLGMKERVGLMNGTFSITSTPHQGTKINIQIPLKGVA